MFCLCQPTSSNWVDVALRNLDAVLVDHAHCEVKAATTALSLALKNHGDLEVVLALTHLAREELEHFARVVGFLNQRGLVLGPPPVDAYAAQLRKAISTTPAGPADPIVDRLLVGALIEARSCERFKLLLEAWPNGAEQELHDFYRELFECEARHYMQYWELAIRVSGQSRANVDARLRTLAVAEGRIVAQLSNDLPTAAVHG